MEIENKVVGYIECYECGQIFYQTHRNQKYCCLHCAELHEKEDNKNRAKKYLQNEENHKKHLIRLATDRLIKKEKLQKHSCCICGTDKNIQAHHPYYNESCIAVVVWLCKNCHEQLHKEMEQ